MKILLLMMISLVSISCSQVKKESNKALPLSLEEAIASTNRNPENKKRDIYRHPQQTLEFFGIQPHMTVVEISPGAGWYTEILAPYLVAKSSGLCNGQ
ncbi:MAG TPA: hypothetical protein VNJ08_04755 [Bacteriovoracaceae bacterium]|nr:hypothetical protein [Bacteriovoracaceae bacterium]